MNHWTDAMSLAAATISLALAVADLIGSIRKGRDRAE